MESLKREERAEIGIRIRLIFEYRIYSNISIRIRIRIRSIFFSSIRIRIRIRYENFCEYIRIYSLFDYFYSI